MHTSASSTLLAVLYGPSPMKGPVYALVGPPKDCKTLQKLKKRNEDTPKTLQCTLKVIQNATTCAEVLHNAAEII